MTLPCNMSVVNILRRYAACLVTSFLRNVSSYFHAQVPAGHIIPLAKHFAPSLVVFFTIEPPNGETARHGFLPGAGDDVPHEIFCLFSFIYAQPPPPRPCHMLFTERGLIFFAGQQSLTRAQVANNCPK